MAAVPERAPCRPSEPMSTSMRVDEVFFPPDQGLMSDVKHQQGNHTADIHRSERLVEIQQKEFAEQKPSVKHNTGLK